jgi:hypothetical protein
MSLFSSRCRASANRQLLRLERLETRDCPSGAALTSHLHVHQNVGTYQTPPGSQPHQYIMVQLHHQQSRTGAGHVAQLDIGSLPTPPVIPPHIY